MKTPDKELENFAKERAESVFGNFARLETDEAAHFKSIVEDTIAGAHFERERILKKYDEKFFREIIGKWLLYWMYQTQSDDDDYRREYLHRAMGVDANMRYDLIDRILKQLSDGGVGE